MIKRKRAVNKYRVKCYKISFYKEIVAQANFSDCRPLHGTSDPSLTVSKMSKNKSMFIIFYLRIQTPLPLFLLFLFLNKIHFVFTFCYSFSVLSVS